MVEVVKAGHNAANYPSVINADKNVGKRLRRFERFKKGGKRDTSG